MQNKCLYRISFSEKRLDTAEDNSSKTFLHQWEFMGFRKLRQNTKKRKRAMELFLL